MTKGVQEFVTLDCTRAQDGTFEGRHALNALPRGRKNFPFVKEFVQFQIVAGPVDPALDDATLLKDEPKGAKVLSRLSFHEGCEEACKILGTQPRDVKMLWDGPQGELIKIGLPSEPEDFLQRAVAGRPPQRWNHARLEVGRSGNTG